MADYLNGEIAKLPMDSLQTFLSYRIAMAICEDSRLVNDVVSRLDGSSNGLICWRGNFNRAMADLSKSPTE